MTLRLTPDTLAASYEYLRTTLPFSRWKLPPSDEVEFHVTRHLDRYGDHNEIWRPADHCIRISSRNVSTTDGLIKTMAHEMVHAYLVASGQRDGHGKNFYREAARVCKSHGWIVKDF